MSSIDKIRSKFQRQGINSSTKLRKSEFDQVLNSLVSGQAFDENVATQIWEQASNGAAQAGVDDICRTISDAQNIIRDRLVEINQDIRLLERQINEEGKGDRNKEQQLDNLIQDKNQFEEDLRLLTQPFGISMISLMAKQNAGTSRNYENQLADDSKFYQDDGKGQQSELKWLFYMSLAFCGIQVVTIYNKYDFLNLMVVACCLLIFFMNHFDTTYLKSVLLLLILSELLDIVWLFMYIGQYWSPPEIGNYASYQSGYLKFIIILTFVGIFLKIPLGVFLYHYRNTTADKLYKIDLGLAKIALTPNKANPITKGIHNSIGIDN